MNSLDLKEKLAHRISRLAASAQHKPYTQAEEIIHSITHGIGTGLSIAGMTVLVVLALLDRDMLRVISFSIYGGTLVILYLASTLYHSFQNPRVKKFFQICDHSAIYLLIAGTYTPFLLIGVRSSLGWIVLILVWGLALFGIGYKALFFHRFERLSVLGYVLMGWIGVITFNELLANVPYTGLLWIAAGGAAYTIGIIFLAWRRLPFNHAIWHLFVLGGSICHYVAVTYLLPGT